MELQKQLTLNLVKSKLLKYAMCSDIDNIKSLYYQYNTVCRPWTLLKEIFIYSCDTMNIKLLETLYEIYTNIDISIRRDNNIDIFKKSIIFQNTLFYNKLLSYSGPSIVFNQNKQKLIDFTIMNRYKFDPILKLLTLDEVDLRIQLITEDVVINYDENIMRCNDTEYMNGNYVYMVFQDEENPIIPLSIVDDQYIKYLENYKKNYSLYG